MTAGWVPTSHFTGRRVLLVGGGSRLGAAIAAACASVGAQVVIAGRDQARLADAASRMTGDVETALVDFEVPSSIQQMAVQVSEIDDVVSTVSMHAAGRIRDLADGDIQRSFDAKIFGAIRLVRATADTIRPGGSYTFFSGQAAWSPAPGGVVTATVNGALAFLVSALAVELAPLRVNAVAPGLIDSGNLDRLGPERKAEMLQDAAAANPVGRVGAPDDVVSATLMVMSNGYMTGTVVHVDGGRPLV